MPILKAEPIESDYSAAGHSDSQREPSVSPDLENLDLSLRQRKIFWVVALASGLLQALASRFDISADSLSYLEIGQAYFREDWKSAINSYWSPLYSWLIAFPLHLFKPSLYWESTFVAAVDLLIYVFALFCLEFLLDSFVLFRKSGRNPNSQAPLPPWAFRLLGYALFLYSGIAWLSVGYMSPDLLVASLVLLDVGIVIRIYTDGPSFARCAFLGLLLGVGYLAKVVLLPVGVVFLFMAVFAGGFARRALARLSLAVVVFGFIATPFIYLLSSSKRHFSYGDAGKHAYSRFVNGVNFSNYYQNAEKRAGVPVRRIKMLLDVPAVYDIGEPFAASYPPWYDPTYWWEGIVPFWNSRAEIGVVHQDLHFFSHLITEQAEFATGFLALLLLSRR